MNTAKRVEGRFFSDATNKGGAGKINLRFAVDLADIGAPVEN